MVEVVSDHRHGPDRLIRRSLGMLSSVRGPIVALLFVGVIASALPYVTAAAFGPMMQVVADAGASGNLSGVWDLRGPLVARENGALSGVAGSVPFAVLLATWAVSLVLAQLMYLVNAWVGTKVERVLVTDILPPSPHRIARSTSSRVAQWRADAARDVESAGVQRLRPAAAAAADRRRRAPGGGLLPGGAVWQMTVAA